MANNGKNGKNGKHGKNGKKKNTVAVPTQLQPFGDEDSVQVIIETPKGYRNKFAWDPERGVFRLKKVLPAGMVFPYDFGFVPSTKAEDGDPIDVLILMDEPAFVGCLLEARLIGVIEGEQKEEDGSTVRNDRLIAIAKPSHTHSEIQELDDLNGELVKEIESFFKNYAKVLGGNFQPIGRRGAGRAWKLVEKAIQNGDKKAA